MSRISGWSAIRSQGLVSAWAAVDDIHHRMLSDGGLMDKRLGIGFFLFDRLFGTLSLVQSSFNHHGYAVARERFRLRGDGRAQGERCGPGRWLNAQSENYRLREGHEVQHGKRWMVSPVATRGGNRDESLERPSAIRLDSWKDIANYLNRSVANRQRWEMVEAMPVHRHCHGTGGSVYAYSPEVDAWRSSPESPKAVGSGGFPIPIGRHWVPGPRRKVSPSQIARSYCRASSGRRRGLGYRRTPWTTRMACWPLKTWSGRENS